MLLHWLTIYDPWVCDKMFTTFAITLRVALKFTRLKNQILTNSSQCLLIFPLPFRTGSGKNNSNVVLFSILKSFPGVQMKFGILNWIFFGYDSKSSRIDFKEAYHMLHMLHMSYLDFFITKTNSFGFAYSKIPFWAACLNFQQYNLKTMLKNEKVLIWKAHLSASYPCLKKKKKSYWFSPFLLWDLCLSWTILKNEETLILWGTILFLIISFQKCLQITLIPFEKLRTELNSSCSHLFWFCI